MFMRALSWASYILHSLEQDYLEDAYPPTCRYIKGFSRSSNFAYK